MLEIQIISEIKLIIGGAAILLIIVNSHKKEIKGEEPKIPFLSKILRENLRKYNKFPPKNIEEELSPWATINISPPVKLILVIYKSLLMTNPICATEEYAIITFMSNWFKQINPINADPVKDTEIKKFIK